MGFSKPVKGVLSLRRCSFDIKGNIRNKITFSASAQNDNQNTNTDFTKSDKFSSKLQFTQPMANIVVNFKNVARKPVVTSLTDTQRNRGNSLSHMPVYHKVITIKLYNIMKNEWSSFYQCFTCY